MNWLRAGQAAFNVLGLVRPDLAERVRGTELDPFYRDDRLDAFFVWLEEVVGGDSGGQAAEQAPEVGGA